MLGPTTCLLRFGDSSYPPHQFQFFFGLPSWFHEKRSASLLFRWVFLPKGFFLCFVWFLFEVNGDPLEEVLQDNMHTEHLGTVYHHLKRIIAGKGGSLSDNLCFQDLHLLSNDGTPAYTLLEQNRKLGEVMEELYHYQSSGQLARNFRGHLTIRLDFDAVPLNKVLADAVAASAEAIARYVVLHGENLLTVY